MKLFKSLMLIIAGSSAFAAGGIGVIQGDAVTFSSMVVTGNVTLNGTCTGSGCGSGGGGSTNGTITAAPQFAPTYYTLSGTTTTVGGLTPNTSGYPLLSGGASAAPFEGPLSGANVSGNISGNAANITGNLPASQIAAGSLGASVLVSSLTAVTQNAGSYTNANITINAQGQVTSASNGSGGGITAGSTTTWTAPQTFNYSVTVSTTATIQSLTEGTTNFGTYRSSGTITMNYALGNIGSVILTSSCTLNGPSNPVEGGKFMLKIKQDAAGNRTVALASGSGNFAFGSGITSFTASTAANAVDYIGVIYDSIKNVWNVVAVQQGF
jgi:hypothetical protein